MPAAQRAAIERTKEGPDGWFIRGRDDSTECWKASPAKENQTSLMSRWTPWIEPLLDQPLFKGVEVLAVEYPICDKIKRVGGTLDFLLRPTDPDDNRVILGDLKTVSSKKGVSSRKPATAQLAAYQSMLASLHPRLMITDLVTVVCGPERTRIINSDAETAWQHWEEAWGRFHATQPDF